MKNLTGENQRCLPDASGRRLFWKLSSHCPKTSTVRGLFALPALPRISNILPKHFNILHFSNRSKDVFKQPPFVAYRSSPNLRNLLVKAQLTVISNNHFSPGFFRCGQLKLCHLSIHGLTSYTFYSTSETRFITSHITCNTKNVIYMVECNRGHLL